MTLREWINSEDKPYSDGIELLTQIGVSSILISVLTKSQSSYNKQKLYNLLHEHFEKSNSKAVEEKVVIQKHVVATKEYPPDVQAIYATRIGAFKKMAALHQELINIQGHSQKAIDSRYKLQLEIIRLDELNEECWDQIHYYEAHGKLPESQNQFNPDTLTIRELVNLEKTIPSYITKYNKELASAELLENRRSELVKRVAEWQIKAQTIKLIIDKLPELSKIKEALC